MLGSHNFSPNMHDLSQAQHLGKQLIKAPAEAARQAHSRPEVLQNESAVNWYVVEQKDGGLKLTAAANTTQVDVTSVNIHADEVSAPKEISFFGYKIDLQAKVDGFKENYVKNYALAKSHNLMVARFAQLKVAFYGFLLSMMGCSVEDIVKLQKKAIGDSIKQNKILFEENEYNAELLAVVGGGSKKQVKGQQKIIGEIRKQLITQAKNLGLKDFYSQETIIDIQIEQCQKILRKFQEEKNNLEYQLAYSGVN
jgi:hypothetical protein